MATRTAGPEAKNSTLSKTDITENLGRAMLRARTVEDKLASLYRAGRIVGGVY
ncbi:thiamine pyrophosphate-dependent dehydrogenase E1 component subunit alpha, partial [bacterium]|nr:thiamine pyrophosphate-dependent dehydrogenase E1 component subunit alpha [bacterium]